MNETRSAPRAMMLAVVVLAGCQSSLPLSRGTPIIRAEDGASAALTIIACPPNNARAMAAGELLQFLIAQDELVVARSGGSARLVINACAQVLPSVPAARVPR